MTPDELLDELHTRNWPAAAAAAWLGVHPRTVSRWLRGSHPIPGYVGRLLAPRPQGERHLEVMAPVVPRVPRVEDGA